MGLKSKKVLITREKKQAQPFAQQVESLGGEAIVADVLSIRCIGDEAVKNLQNQLSDYEWLFFTSANGVNCFFNELDETGHANLHHLKFAVVGTKTNEALERHGKTATFTPSIYNAQTMGKEFLKAYPNPGKMLLVRGSKARPELVETLTAGGYDFELLEVYKTGTNKAVKEKLNNILVDETMDYITFTSPSTVDAFCELITTHIDRKTVVVCIGTTTQKRAYEQGFQNLIVPEKFTIEGMLDVMNEHAGKRGNDSL